MAVVGERICCSLCLHVPALLLLLLAPLLLSTWTATPCEGMFSAEALQFNAALETSLLHKQQQQQQQQQQHNTHPHTHTHTHTHNEVAPPGEARARRSKRGAIWDFFSKVGITTNLIADQFIDTKNTLSEVYNLVNAGFSDPAPDKPTLRPTTTTTAKDASSGSSSSEEVSTTTEKYQISRYEFGRILGRNFRGLQRLMRIELQDAFNQSKYNIQEYRAEARKQFSNSIAVEKKNQLRQRLKG